jgi:lysophospholipase L1-like esterase
VEIVRDRLAGGNISIHNRSHPTDSSFEGVYSFYDDIAPFYPDILFLHFGIDDIYRPVYRSEFKENLVQIIRLARKLFDPRIFLLTSHPFEDRLEMDTTLIYYRAIREVALDLSCRLVPVHLCGPVSSKSADRRRFPSKDTRLPMRRAMIFTRI